MSIRNVTPEEVKQAMIDKGIERVDHHECGGCYSMVFYHRAGEDLFFNPDCACVNYSAPPELREWSEASNWINMQNYEWKIKLAKRFGIDLTKDNHNVPTQDD